MKKAVHATLFAYLLFLSLSILSLKSFSQDGIHQLKWEAGITVGPSFFLGDLGGNAGKGTRFIKDVNLEFTKVVKGGFICMYPNDWLGFRLAAQTGYLEAADAVINTNGTFEMFRKQRNLDFRSNLKEAYLLAEVYPLIFLNKNNPDYSRRLQPYVSLGIGVFHFNPQGSLTDAYGNKAWHYLRPLHTEGQGKSEYPNRKSYSLTQPVVPIGAGFKYFISDRVNVSFEILTRKSFTDYIDDVSTSYINPELFDKYLSQQDAAVARQIHDKVYGSTGSAVSRYAPGEQRGNPKQNDSFFSLLTKVGIRLGSIYESSLSKKERGHLKCPARF